MRLHHVVIPILIGAGLGLFGASAAVRFAALIYPLPSVTLMAALGLSAGVALGIRLPQHYARLSERLTRRFRRDDDLPHDMLVAGQDPMTRLQLAVIEAGCLIGGGLGMMGLCLIAPLFAAAHAALLNDFHWTSITLFALDGMIVAGFVIGPAVLCGVAVNCDERLRPHATTTPGLGPLALLIGLTAGLIAAARGEALHPNAGFLTAALLLLAGGLLLTVGDNRPASRSQHEYALPQLSARWRGLLIWMLCVLGLLTTYQVLCWKALLPPDHSRFGLAAGAAAFTAGFRLRSTPPGRYLSSLKAISTACITLALILTLMMVWITGQWHRHGFESGAVGMIAWTALLVPTGIMGVIVAATLIALTECYPHPASGSLTSLAALAAGSAAACALLPRTVPLSTYVLMVIIILLWLLLGGLLLIHEPRFAWRRRRLAVGLMLGTLAACIWILPARSGPWDAMSAVLDSERIDLQVMHPAPRPHELATAICANARTLGSGGRVDQVLRHLALDHEHHDNIIVNLYGLRSRQVTAQHATLIHYARKHLIPDGLLVIRFCGGDPGPSGVEQWYRFTAAHFGSAHATVLRGCLNTEQWCILGQHTADPVSDASFMP